MTRTESRQRTRHKRMAGKDVIQVPLPAKAISLIRLAAQSIPGLAKQGDAAAVRYFLSNSAPLQAVAYKQNVGWQELDELLNGYKVAHHEAHKCPGCDGRGKFSIDGVWFKCQQCNGTGQLAEPISNEDRH